jgi:hypothetical protein
LNLPGLDGALSTRRFVLSFGPISKESIVSTFATYNDEIRAKLADAEAMLVGLESGGLHLGLPFEGRSEAKAAGLRQDIARYKAILGETDA